MSKFCQRCKQSNPSEAAFCLNCAAPLGASSGRQQQANQPWHQPNFSGPAVDKTFEASSRAKLALGLSLAGMFCLGPLASIPAIILGWMEISAINQGQSSAAGKSITTFGIGMAVVSLVLQVGGFFLWILFAIAISADASNY